MECSSKTEKRSTYLLFMLDLKKTVCWYSRVLRIEDGHVLRRAFDFEVEGQRKKGRPERTWKKHVETESMMVGLRMEDALCRSK